MAVDNDGFVQKLIFAVIMLVLTNIGTIVAGWTTISSIEAKINIFERLQTQVISKLDAVANEQSARKHIVYGFDRHINDEGKHK